MRQSGYRSELEDLGLGPDLDPVALFVIPLAILLLSIVVIRAIVVATTV